MGMFDYVNVKIPCPRCKVLLDGFQSKDSSCMLEIIDPSEVYCFYTKCDNCNMWVQYNREPPQSRMTHRLEPYSLDEIKDMGFELTVREWMRFK